MQITDMWVEWCDPGSVTNELTRLTVPEARSVRFETAKAVRAPDGYRGQPNIAGLFASAKSGRGLYMESLREWQALTLLEFDPRVACFATQPLLLAVCEGGQARRLVPDVFVRYVDGSGRLLEIKTSASLQSERVQRRLALAAAACEQLGIEYRVETEPDRVLWRNIKWISGNRKRGDAPPALAQAMEEACRSGPRFVAELVALGPNYWARSTLFHLLWHHRLKCDLSQPLRSSTLVSRPPVFPESQQEVVPADAVACAGPGARARGVIG